MKLALAQINTIVGDLEGNVAHILSVGEQAKALGAELVVFPEMAVPGYPPRDILYDVSFVESVQAATLDLATRARDLPPLLVGSFQPSGQKLCRHPALHNVAWLIQGGKMKLAAIKRLLPVYDVFYEPRWFVPAEACLPPLDMAGIKIGVLICEDLWDKEYPVHPGSELKRLGAEMLICLSAAPYRRGAGEERLYHAKRQGLPVAFVNLVGGNDELIFDGGSFWLDGRRLDEASRFEEKLLLVDISPLPTAVVLPPASRVMSSPVELAGTTICAEGEDYEEDELFRALALGVRDFARKNRLEHAVLGLSGGVDSSVTAVLAVRALGAAKVTGVAIPSRYTDPRSTACARELAEVLGMRFEVVEMEAVHRSVQEALGGRLEGIADENVQARIRMLILMSFVNRRGGFLLNTSNKTELTLGYGTLYGDLAGALSPLGDLTKPEVYALARWINTRWAVIPSFVLERKPSAELRANQVDPFDYETLAPEMERLVLVDQSNAVMRAAEHKRCQFGIVLKVSARAFGSGRMMPVTRR
ncbi:MAG: NAD+ synthase [Anaerolineales bacterium]